MRYPSTRSLVLLIGLLAGCTGGSEPGPQVAGDTQPESGNHFIGSAACKECHTSEYELWEGSHHQLAMQEATTSG